MLSVLLGTSYFNQTTRNHLSLIAHIIAHKIILMGPDDTARSEERREFLLSNSVLYLEEIY